MARMNENLTFSQKAGWGLADTGIVVFVIVKQLLVLSFLTNYLGIAVGLAGALTTAILLFDMLIDPVIGYLSDKTNSRYGRRAPWMALGALVLAGGMVGLFAVPQDLTQYGILTWVGGFFALTTVGFTMVSIPYGASAGEITKQPKERSAMMAYRMGFASLGILIGGALIPQLAGGTREGHFFAALCVAPVIVLAIWLSLWTTRKAPKEIQPSSKSFSAMVSLVFANRPFIILVLLYGVMTLAIAIITAGLPFAALYLIQDNGFTALSGAANGLGILSLMFAAFVLGSILSQAIWVWVSHLLGKMNALTLGLVLYIVLLTIIFNSLPSTNVTFIALLFVCAGITNGAYQQIPWAIYPDLMDVTNSESGEAIEGAFSAIWLVGQKVANALAPSILAGVLALYGWQETTGELIEQQPEALAALQIGITLLPAVILGVAILGILALYRPALRKT